MHYVVERSYRVADISGILHQEGNVAQSVVLPASCGPENVYVSLCAGRYKPQGKTESLGLVIGLLTAALSDYLPVFFKIFFPKSVISPTM